MDGEIMRNTKKEAIGILVCFAIIAIAVLLVFTFWQKPAYNNIGGGQAANGCISNADCGIGGCSGQICGAAEEINGIITTCEFRPEYACLGLTSCGCVAGKCKWVENTEYTACLKEKSSYGG